MLMAKDDEAGDLQSTSMDDNTLQSLALFDDAGVKSTKGIEIPSISTRDSYGSPLATSMSPFSKATSDSDSMNYLSQIKSSITEPFDISVDSPREIRVSESRWSSFRKSTESWWHRTSSAAFQFFQPSSPGSIHLSPTSLQKSPKSIELADFVDNKA